MAEPKQYKIVMLGGGAVGKSALTVQLVSGHFLESYDPTIEDSYRTTICVDGTNVMLDILDTAGQEEFSALRDQYMRSGNGYVIVFSITSTTSFLEANTFREQLYRVLDKAESDVIPIILAGNKCDLENERQVQKADAQKLADEWKIEYIEVSAKNRINVQETFEALVRFIDKQSEGNKPAAENNTPAPTPKGGCCVLF